MAAHSSLADFLKRRFTQRTEDVLTAYLCLLPWIIGFLAFTLGPLVFSLVLSFFQADLFTRNVFVGLGNYVALVQDPLFLKSLRITAIYAFVSVPLGAATALAVALLLNQKVVGTRSMAHSLLPPFSHIRCCCCRSMVADFQPKNGLNQQRPQSGGH